MFWLVRGFGGLLVLGGSFWYNISVTIRPEMLVKMVNSLLLVRYHYLRLTYGYNGRIALNIGLSPIFR